MPGLRLGTLLLGLLMVPGVAAAQARLGGQLPPESLLNRYGLERAWASQATINSSRDRVAHLMADEDVVVLQSSAGVVTCFDAETGRRRWSTRLGRPDSPSTQAGSNEDLVLIAVGSDLYALNKITGRLTWRVGLPGEPSTSPTMDQRHVYIGTMDGNVYAYNLRRIRERFEQGHLPRWSFHALDWRFQSNGPISTPPVAFETQVTFASRGGMLTSVAAEDRDLVYQLETSAAISAPLALSEEPAAEPGGRSRFFFYAASEDVRLYCLNARSGSLRWDAVLGRPIKKAPRVIGDHVYLTPERGGLHALSKYTGDPVWWVPGLVEFLAATETRIFASDDQGNVAIVSPRDGAPMGVVPMRHFPIRVSNDRTDRVYLATDSGLVVCLREQGRESALYHMFPHRRPLTPEFAPEAPEGETVDGKEAF